MPRDFHAVSAFASRLRAEGQEEKRKIAYRRNGGEEGDASVEKQALSRPNGPRIVAVVSILKGHDVSDPAWADLSLSLAWCSIEERAETGLAKPPGSCRLAILSI